MDPQAPGASLEIVGEKTNELVTAIEELRQLGLKELDTELPELVLVGDQSAGKSTLMGAIAEINLPKDKGMCTRCPTNIKTSPGNSWSCKVSLHQYYYYSTDSKRTPAPNKANRFPPWKEKTDGLTIKPFKTISEKSELEDVLRWAQIALLNPGQVVTPIRTRLQSLTSVSMLSRDPKLYVPGSGAIAEQGLKPGEKHQADFSPNVIAIEICGPRLPALSFYDLPGNYVSAASAEETYLIQVFDFLTEKYIKHENALVICAITMANDPGSSKSSAIIRDFKADKRCIGVLTMPDRLAGGSTHQDFDDILRGKTYVFPHGYHVTKQPGPDFQLRPGYDYHAQAREEEEDFFQSDPRWSGEWSSFQSRCGTGALQKRLSDLLALQIFQR